jgi:ABC-2 type transport system permease protein
MTGLIRNELHKLRTVRAPWLVFAAAQPLVVAGVSGAVLNAANPRAVEVMIGSVGHAGLISLFSLVLGIVVVTNEYRHRTITDTYLGTPKRGRVIGAKLAVGALLGAALGVVSAVTALAATAVWLAARDGSLDLSNVDLWRTVVGGVIWNTTFAAIGIGLGALLRNMAAAIGVAMAWLVLVEGVLSQLVSGLGRWLPFASGTALNHLPSAAAGLPQWGAATVLVGYAVAFAVVAVSTTVRRDVT